MKRAARRAESKRSKKAIQKSLAQRACGECTACCTVMGVAEIHKAPGEPCSKLCASGCSVYESRPRGCREFNCLWRMGLLGPEGRPDRLGAVLDMTEKPGEFEQFVVARPAFPGGLETARPTLDELVRDGHVVILLNGASTKALARPDRVDLVRRRLNVVA